jgi:leucyl aminopeptidase
MAPSGPAPRLKLPPAQPEIRVRHQAGKPGIAALEKLEHLIIVIPAQLPLARWKDLPNGKQLYALQQQRKLVSSPLRASLPNRAHTGISLQPLEKPATGDELPAAFELLSYAGNLAADALRDNPASAGLLVTGFSAAATDAIQRALVLALAGHSFSLQVFKSKVSPGPRLRTVHVIGKTLPADLPRTLAEAAANNLARWLTALPPNILDTVSYRDLLAQLGRRHGWKTEFLGETQLRRAGAGAFLAVAQGNASRDAGIVHLQYRPVKKQSSPPHLALIGKGIIFDTGGTNLKPFKAMLDMHHDMAGSAVAVATLMALTELDYPHPVDCWLAITENRLSNAAYKPRDIVTASNGTTIEVVHTDAEGRMALADTLALAGKTQPRTLLDFATLTGTCVSALTERYSGAFTNRPELHTAIISAGQLSGERVWPFPLDPDFDDDIKSEVADVLQCAPDGGGDHIQAARFLQRFVPEQSAWVHIDLSAASRKGGLAQIPTAVTGFGVRFALNLILDQAALLSQHGRS